jgi:tetratricopeptide (TPR) repeat protein
MKAVTILDRLFEALRTAPLFGLQQRLLDDRSKLLVAERFAAAGEFNTALNVARNLSLSLTAPVPFWQYLWRRWQVRPLIARLNAQTNIWNSIVREYYLAFRSAESRAAAGDFAGAESVLDRALNIYPHPQGLNFLKTVERLRQGQEWLRLGLSAELIGSVEIARYHYTNLIDEFPELRALCHNRLAALAIGDRDWAAAIKYTNNSTDQLAIKYNGLAHYQQHQQQRWQLLREIQHQIQIERLDQAWQSCLDYIEQFGTDSLVQQILTEYIQPQLTTVPTEWSDRCQITQQRWQNIGGKTLLHDWAIAAYYRYQFNPDRLDWLRDLVPIWVTASINTSLDSKLTDPQPVIIQIRNLVVSLIDRFTDETDRAELQLQWQREIMALEYLSTPPTTGLRIRGVFISPGFYDLFQSQMTDIQLPAKKWAMFYTPWWRSIVACHQGNPVQAMVFKPTTPPDTAASKFAQQFVAYHEGCYYLECRPGGFPRWREAFAMLELAKPQILDTPAWQSTLDRLCDTHQLSIWNPPDRQEFAICWHNLLLSDSAKVFLDFVTNPDSD